MPQFVALFTEQGQLCLAVREGGVEPIYRHPLTPEFVALTQDEQVDVLLAQFYDEYQPVADNTNVDVLVLQALAKKRGSGDKATALANREAAMEKMKPVAAEIP